MKAFSRLQPDEVKPRLEELQELSHRAWGETLPDVVTQVRKGVMNAYNRHIMQVDDDQPATIEQLQSLLDALNRSEPVVKDLHGLFASIDFIETMANTVIQIKEDR